MVVVAQLAELGCGPSGCGFESRRPPINKTVPICRDCFVLCVFFFMYTWLHRESKERYNKNMSKYVLLIEDDPSLQKAYQMKFETKGIAARVVGDGKEMIQLLNQNTMELPGVVILDLLLPYVSGFEVLEEMRKTEGWHDVPVVIVSNVREEGGVQKAERLGVKNTLLKQGSISMMR